MQTCEDTHRLLTAEQPPLGVGAGFLRLAWHRYLNFNFHVTIIVSPPLLALNETQVHQSECPGVTPQGWGYTHSNRIFTYPNLVFLCLPLQLLSSAVGKTSQDCQSQAGLLVPEAGMMRTRSP